MTEFSVLKILDRFKWIFQKMGIDYGMMRAILSVKLLMDQRKVPTIFNQSGQKKEKEDKYAYTKSLWIYALMGLTLIPFMGFGTNYLFQMSIAFGIILFLIMTSMISDFSSVLLDIRDKHILHTKPVNRKTLNAAKVLHIMIYIIQLTFAITVVPLIVSLFNKGIIFFLLTILSLLLSVLFILVITALLYLFILKFFDGEKLNDMINYVQIALSITIMVGYQLVIRSFEFIDLQFVYDMQWWNIFIVPMWFAAPYEYFLNGDQNPIVLLFTLLAVVFPILSILIYIKLIPTFEKSLEKLTNHSSSKKPKQSKLINTLLSVLIKNKEEQAFFHFTGQMMKQEREFKLKVYPSLGFSIIIPFLLLYSGTDINLHELSISSSYFSIYFIMINIPTILLVIKYSGKYKGAWIFTILPIYNYANYYKASIKSILIYLFMPIYLLLSVIFLFLFGIRILPDLIIVLLSACLYAVICFFLSERTFPFSEPIKTANTEGWKTMLLLLFILLFAGIHYGSTFLPYGTYTYCLILLIVNYIAWTMTFKKKEMLV